MGYIMRDGPTPGLALYTRCEDELWAKAELLLLTEKAIALRPEGGLVIGYLDVDPTFTIKEFKRAYPKSRDMQRLSAARQKIIREGWTYPEYQQ